MKLGTVRGKGGADRVAAAVGDSGRLHQVRVTAEGSTGNLTEPGSPGEVTFSGIGALSNPVETR